MNPPSSREPVRRLLSELFASLGPPSTPAPEPSSCSPSPTMTTPKPAAPKPAPPKPASYLVWTEGSAYSPEVCADLAEADARADAMARDRIPNVVFVARIVSQRQANVAVHTLPRAPEAAEDLLGSIQTGGWLPALEGLIHGFLRSRPHASTTTSIMDLLQWARETTRAASGSPPPDAEPQHGVGGQPKVALQRGRGPEGPGDGIGAPR